MRRTLSALLSLPRQGRRRGGRYSAAGFTLLEALISTALMGAILAALAMVTAQWLPSWNRGFIGVQRSELLALGLERLVADLAAAEFVPPNREAPGPVFEGNQLSVIFARSAIGPNARPSLDLVRIMEIGGAGGATLVRTRAPFVPFTPDSRPNFIDPVVVVRPPYRITFSYAGRNRIWQDSWRDQLQLPTAIRLQVRDAATARILSVSTAMLVHAALPSDCLRAASLDGCFNLNRNKEEAAAGGNSTANSPAGGRLGGGL